MAVAIMWDQDAQVAAMWDTTTDHAFGPVFSGASAVTEIEEFLDWLETSDVPWAVGSHVTGDGTDPRHYPPGDLEEVVKHWRLLVEDGDA